MSETVEKPKALFYWLNKSVYWASPSVFFSEDTAFEAGVRVQIHSQAEPPFVHELGFGVAPGFQTFVATQEQRVGVPDVALIPS